MGLGMYVIVVTDELSRGVREYARGLATATIGSQLGAPRPLDALPDPDAEIASLLAAAYRASPMLRS